MNSPVSLRIKSRRGIYHDLGFTDERCRKAEEATRSSCIPGNLVGHSFAQPSDHLLRLPCRNASSTRQPLRAGLSQGESATSRSNSGWVRNGSRLALAMGKL